MKEYEVLRIGKCPLCEHKGEILVGEVSANSEEEAIDKALENWNHENFGDGGALREEDKSKEENFMNAKFIARKI